MWLWILSALFVALVWAVWFILQPTDPGVGIEVFPTWVAILITAIVVLLLVGLVVYRRVRAARAARALEKAIAEQAQEQALSAKPERRAEIQELERRVLEGIAALKTSKLGGGRRGSDALYSLPWYVMIGPPGAGKTTALRHSGLVFPYLDPSGGGVRGVGGTRNCDWWFTNEAILLDTAGRYTTATEDHDEWMAFLEMLLRFRSHKPINGVLVAVSVSELLDSTEEQITQTARRVRERVDELQETLKMRVPVYVLFTKTDLVAGFVEFFGDLRKSERGQGVGSTLRLDADRKEPGKIFDSELDTLIERLHQRGLRRLAVERGRDTKEKVFQFPLEFAAVKRNLADFLATAFAPGPSVDATPLLRGFYFTSGTQEGRPMDRVLGAMGRAFGLKPGATEEAAPTGESKSYFLHDVFTKVVFPDQDLASRTAAEVRRQRFQRLAIALAAIAVAAVMLVPAVLSFMNNRDLVAETSRISNEAADVRWDPKADSRPVTVKIDKLDKLRSHAEMLDAYEEEGPPLSYTWAMYQGDRLYDPTINQYIRSLEQGFVLPTRAHLEGKLKLATGAKYIDDFNNLKAYLLLDDPIHLQDNADWEVGRLTQAWAEVLRPQTELSDADLRATILPHVKFYVDLLKRVRVKGVPRDEALVARARDVLSRVGANQKYYDQFVTVLIDEKYDEAGPTSIENLKYPPVTLSAIFADRQEVLTKLKSRKKEREGEWFRVEGPYTDVGHEAVLVGLAEGFDRLEREKWVVPLSGEEKQEGDKIQQALNRVRQDYDSEYIRQWQAFFRDIDVTIPANNIEAIEEYRALSTPDWPYLRLLRSLSDHTQFKKDDEGGQATTDGGLIDQLKEKVQRKVQAKTRVNVKDFLSGDGKTERIDPIPEKFRTMVAFGVADAPPAKEGEPPPPPPQTGLSSYVGLLEQLAGEMGNVEDGPPTADTAKARESFEEAVQTAQALLLKMDETGQELMTPLLMNPLKQGYKALVRRAGGAASGLWEVVVWPTYRDKIKDRYPFNLASTRDASLEDAVAFFKPGDGILWGFYGDNLKGFHYKTGHDFIPSTHLAPRPRPARPFTPFNANLYNCLRRSDEITAALFPGGGEKPKVEFTVNVKTVSPIVSDVIFEVDGQRKHYRNEKEFSQVFTWPGEKPTGARLQVKGAGGLDEEIVRTGPWGLFRLLETGTAEAVAESDEVFTVTWQMTAPPVTVTIEIKPARSAHPFPMSFFRATNCPPSIGDSFGKG